jgi:hypothetical protein
MISAKIHWLHLVMGEIGGAGKSWFAKLLLEAYISLKVPYHVVDCDESTPNVGRAYDRPNYDPVKIAEHEKLVVAAELELKPLIQAVFHAAKVMADAPGQLKIAQAAFAQSNSADNLKASEDAVKVMTEAPGLHEQAVKALDEARFAKMPPPLRERIYFISEGIDDLDLPSEMIGMAMKKDTVVNFPAQVGKPANNWIEGSGLLSMTKYGLNTVCWFVAKPTVQSMEQLRELHEFHKGNLKIVLVKNHFVGLNGNWDRVIDDVMKAFLDNAGIIQLDLRSVALNVQQRQYIDTDYATFSELIDEEDRRLVFHEKNKISEYLRSTIESILGTGLLPIAVASESVADTIPKVNRSKKTAANNSDPEPNVETANNG